MAPSFFVLSFVSVIVDGGVIEHIHTDGVCVKFLFSFFFSLCWQMEYEGNQQSRLFSLQEIISPEIPDAMSFERPYDNVYQLCS